MLSQEITHKIPSGPAEALSLFIKKPQFFIRQPDRKAARLAFRVVFHDTSPPFQTSGKIVREALQRSAFGEVFQNGRKQRKTKTFKTNT
jgi:hypothetical protein